MLLKSKKERAMRNMEKGFYNEASKDIEQVLQIEPDDTEAKVMRAKIRTLS
jgi:Tfp pilus assembly protein PilF